MAFRGKSQTERASNPVVIVHARLITSALKANACLISFSALPGACYERLIEVVALKVDGYFFHFSRLRVTQFRDFDGRWFFGTFSTNLVQEFKYILTSV